jgi:hypothetical protein
MTTIDERFIEDRRQRQKGKILQRLMASIKADINKLEENLELFRLFERAHPDFPPISSGLPTVEDCRRWLHVVTYLPEPHGRPHA